MRRWKKILSASLVAVMVGSLGMTAFAEDTSANEPIDTTVSNYNLTEEKTSGKNQEEIKALQQQKIDEVTQQAYDMKIASNELENWPEGPATYGEAGIVMEAKSGAILYAKNIDGKAYPASITKILTALVALENGNLDDKITITQNSVDCVAEGDAYIGMIAGEEISLNDALHALLMASANEVAYAIAENVGGLGYDGFIAKMNERAKELGAVNSDFENPNGLNAQNHYTTARDMALITQELLENHEEFKTIAQTQQYTIGATNLVNQARTFQQSDLMFYEGNDYYYPKTIAGKTGYTDEALNTLVSCAADDNLELISVVLKTHGKNVYPDSINLLEYGFNNFAKYTIADYEDSADFKEIDPNAYVVLPENVNFQSLDYEITQDDTNSSTGTVTYTYQGNPVGKAAVTLSDEYLQKDNTENEAQVSGDKSDSETQKQAQSTIPREVILVICVIAAVLLLIIVWRAVLKHLRKKKVETNRKRRREVDKD